MKNVKFSKAIFIYVAFVNICLSTISCKKAVNYNEILSPVHVSVQDLKAKKLYLYSADTIFSNKISNNKVTKNIYISSKNKWEKHSLFYTVPIIYSNIKPKNNKPPYNNLGAESYKYFYKYIRDNTKSIYLAYVVNNNQVVFKDYIKEYTSYDKNPLITNEQFLKYLKSSQLKFKVLKNKFDNESGRYYLLLKTYKEKDSALSYIKLSKFEFECRTFYKCDTLINWNKTTYKNFRY